MYVYRNGEGVEKLFEDIPDIDLCVILRAFTIENIYAGHIYTYIMKGQ